MEDDDQVALAVFVSIGLVAVVCVTVWWIWREVDAAIWAARRHKEKRKSERERKLEASLAARRQQHEYSAVLDEFGLAESDLTNSEAVRERVAQAVDRHRRIVEVLAE